ncbi:hypothetical protein GT3570_11520 [Geobacillus thermoleovorans]|uniref:hypothetical protein n=1 Tax=Geobacillus thermoleovorans TaxID=33941 RepID=UPI00078BC6DC|nr:hypothetical protein GT3570_11520 [Geobacillus thermoleovorans]
MTFKLEDLKPYIDPNQFNHLHPEAFLETFNYIYDFVQQSQAIYTYLQKHPESEMKYIKRVLNSPPGQGKTTALQTIIKMNITDAYQKHPFLLVFNNGDTMNAFVQNIYTYTDIPKTILAVDDENIHTVKPVIQEYQMLCITQQRFRDLALDFGNRELFTKYAQKAYWGRLPSDIKLKHKYIPRTIIADEMPIFFDTAVFDISSENNSVDWFDELAENTDNGKLISFYKAKGRGLINELINYELLHSVGKTTKKLIRKYEGTDTESVLRYILDSLNTHGVEMEHLNKFKWFKRLLFEDDVGAIDRNGKKTVILCSKYIDYSSFGNILVLDGTAIHTSEVYRHGGYDIVEVKNYHNYKDRLTIEWCKINTSSSARNDKEKEIKEKIASDIISKRKNGIDVLPIPSKEDTNFYIQSGAITPEQYERFFKEKINENDQLTINIRNLTGKNDLNEYNRIALLNLPVLPPQQYKLQAIALYGTNIDLRLVRDVTDKEEQKLYKDQWFVDPRLQKLFEQQMKADLSQIIHRTSIRNINSDAKVTVTLYHNKPKTNKLLQEIFRIPNENIIEVPLQQNEKFKEKCYEWAELVYEYLRGEPNRKFTARKVGGQPFKNFINRNWDQHKTEIVTIFSKFNIKIILKNNGYKYFMLVDDGVFENVSEKSESNFYI